MANTYVLIASSTVGSGGASSITFSSIPSTYTDLIIKFSLRGNAAGTGRTLYCTVNGSITGYYYVVAASDASAPLTFKGSNSANIQAITDSADETASTFGNGEWYIPNYAGSTIKCMSLDSVSENNATTSGSSYIFLTGGYWNSTSAINSVTITPNSGNLAQYSTAYLYGIKSS